MPPSPILAPVLGDADLPWAELQAARLDGELYNLGEAFCPIDQLETPAHRARAAIGRRSRRLIVELGTAAWVWGAALEPTAIRFAVTPTARARLAPDRQVAVREIVYADGDIVDLDGVQVTSPLRTAVDLARFEEPFCPATVARLAAIGGFALVDCVALLQSRSNVPAKRRALRNLTAALI